MARGRVEHMDRLLWNHTAAVMGMVHDVQCVKKGDQKGFGYWNPYRKRKQQPDFDFSQLSPEEKAAVRKKLTGKA